MASVVVGFSTVETLQIATDPPHAAPVVAPAGEPPCDRMPVAIVPGDYDGDGVSDLWTQEACGGNWVAIGPDYLSGVGSAAHIPTGPGPYEYVNYFDTPEGALVLGGTTLSAYMLRRTGNVWSEAVWLSLPSSVEVRVTDIWVPLKIFGGAAEFLFQGHEHLFVVEASNSELVVTRTLAQNVGAPYLHPFAAFDHLTAPDPEACPDVLMGIGLFRPGVTGAPRRLQVLTLDVAAYAVFEPSLGLDEVTSFSVATIDDGTLLVGVIGKREGRDLFLLGELDECVEFATLAEREIELDLKTPPLPRGYDQSFVSLTAAIRFATLVSRGTVSFAHYDGFDLRVISAEHTGSGWQLEERHHEIHSQRSDSSFDQRVTRDSLGL